MIFRLSILFVFLFPFIAEAQVEHNFEKGPENTDCHTITFSHENEKEFATDLMQRTYRFSEELTISRYQSPRKLNYLSCDGKTGFVIAKLSDDRTVIHPEVSLASWDALMDADDVIGYYQGTFTTEFPVWKPEKQ